MSKWRGPILIGGAILLCASPFLLRLKTESECGSAEPKPGCVPTVFAVNDIPGGQEITADAVIVRWAPERHALHDMHDVIGAKAGKDGISWGHPIFAKDLSPSESIHEDKDGSVVPPKN